MHEDKHLEANNNRTRSCTFVQERSRSVSVSEFSQSSDFFLLVGSPLRRISWRHTTSRCGPPTPHVPGDIGTVTGSAPVGRSSLILNPHLAGPTSRPGRGRAARAHRAFQINGFLGLGRLTRHSTRGNGERRLRAPSIVMTKSTGRGATATTTTSMMVPSTMCHRSPMHGSA